MKKSYLTAKDVSDITGVKKQRPTKLFAGLEKSHSMAKSLGVKLTRRSTSEKSNSGFDLYQGFPKCESCDQIDGIERRKEMKREYVITITASYDDLVETETNLRRAREIAKDWLKDKDVKSVSIDRWTHDEFGEECIDDSFDEEYYDKEARRIV